MNSYEYIIKLSINEKDLLSANLKFSEILNALTKFKHSEISIDYPIEFKSEKK